MLSEIQLSAGRVLVFDTTEDVAIAAAERFAFLAEQAIVQNGLFTVALAGGTTPRRTYELLADEALRDRIDWTRVHLFLGDERAVPRNHADSNYRLALTALISHIDIPNENVHPINGEVDPQINARRYEEDLKAFFRGRKWPSFDLILLGLGEDGHTASLFPHTVALREKRAWVLANWVEKLGAYRLTLTPPAIIHAAEIIFLVTGPEKAATLATVLFGPSDPETFPAQMIKPVSGTLNWLVDHQAASRLTRAVQPISRASP